MVQYFTISTFCDDGKCQCCECENEHPQETTTCEEINYNEYIDNLND